ncbi:hypothetical protein ACERIM_10710 [Natrinema sp. H-ect1]|uniref:hypothetical protein n=1 Tax=Natrinema sp. H-ect1 TaxID=3242700 RepID=UPI00359E14DE
MVMPEAVLEEMVEVALKDCEYISGRDNINVQTQMHFSTYFLRGERPDILIVKEVNRFPQSLDQIENIERWFPEKKMEIPVIGIYVKRSSFEAASTWIGQNLTGAYEENSDIPVTVTIHNSDGHSQYVPNSDVQHVIEVNLTDPAQIQEDLCGPISDILEEIENIDIEDLPDVEEFVNSFKSTVFHFNEVLRAYKEGQKGPLIVLLSVFFESHCYNLVEDHLQKIKPNDNSGIFVDEDDNFDTVLNICRFYQLIEEDEYTVIDLIKRSRNKYAHELDRYHSSEETIIEEQGRLRDAISIYEDFIGVEDSMLE